jgi:hypothetical protein
LNIFKILSSGDASIKEPHITSFLCHFLNPYESHGLKSTLLESFLQMILSDTDSENSKIKKSLLVDGKIKDLSIDSTYYLQIDQEYSVQESDNKRRDIDVLLKIKKERPDFDSPDFIIAIENKIQDGAFQQKQLTGELKGLIKDYDSLENPPEIVFVLLSKSGSNRASKHFQEFKNSITKENIPLTVFAKHIYWDLEPDTDWSMGQLFLNLLEKEKDGYIEPISSQTAYLIKSFISFIRTGFTSYQEDLETSRQKSNYGKPVREFVKEIAESYSMDEIIKVSELESKLEQAILEFSGMRIKQPTKFAQVRIPIVNWKTRVNHVKRHDNEDQMLFYGLDEKCETVKRLDLNNIPEDTKVYWKENDEKMEAKLKERYE